MNATERPRDLVVSGAEYPAALADIAAQGGKVVSVERVTASNSTWRVRVFWPDSGSNVRTPSR